MTFPTVLYVVFLVLVWLLYRLSDGPRQKQLLLLGASYLFYASWNPWFLIVLLLSSVWNYGMGLLLRQRAEGSLLFLGIAVNVALLAAFRYFGPGGMIAPVGISFYTFQGISYLIDTYRDPDSFQPSLTEFLLYLAFWPTVLAGPVCRVEELGPQFRRPSVPSRDDIAEGVRRFVIGLFFKVFLADLLASGIGHSEGVDTGFDSLAGPYSGIDVWFLAIGYGFQLYFDFAGYSHMAIGCARMFGIRLRENFASPYLSTTPSEFWTRWHMSLSFWIRDYVFFPLASARPALWWRNATLVLAMTVFGLWHGPKWTLVFWGLYQGVLLTGHRAIQKFSISERPGVFAVIQKTAGWAATFALIMLGWVLFRANTLEQAEGMLRSVITPQHYFQLSLRVNFYLQVMYTALGYFLFAILGRCTSNLESRSPLARLSWLASPVAYAAMLIAVIVWMRHATTFVYAQF